MKRIRLLVAAAALTVVGALSAPAATVSAGPGPARISGIRRPADPAAAPVCLRGDVCGWTGKNYSGTRGALEETIRRCPRSPGTRSSWCGTTAAAKAATWRKC
jgi:hypothetical protein